MITLFLGGASSGKSGLAEACAAARGPEVTYVATYDPAAAGPDEDMADRVRRHRQRRPAWWGLAELEAGGDLGELLLRLEGLVLVDALGTWVAGRPGFAVDSQALCAALRERKGDSVVVSDEVGSSVHPESHPGRLFRESLGGLNAAVASVADEAYLVVAGRVVALSPAPWSP